MQGRVNLSGLDLNLLVALNALIEEQNVTRAGERVGLTQPAMSAALARLRRHFGDELMVRHGNRYELTPLGAALRHRAELAVAAVERVFGAQPDFDPLTAEREFTVLLSDYALMVLGPILANLLETRAPRVRLRLEPHGPTAIDDAETTLRGVDLLLLPHGFVSGYPSQDLYRDGWVCVVAADNDAIGEALTAEQLRTLPWITQYHRPTAATTADRQLALLGFEHRVDLVIESFLPLPFLLAGTRRIALIQRRLAERLAPAAGVRVLPCPIEVTDLVEAAWWHPLHATDPAHQWLRSLFADAAATLK
ncbi:LysR family transcriptional regulator [Cryptosporangium aurantiacum]|uniref:DNA-binding transcriptional regulator, LysR family n=1 Tax=Cryptosporangium aurantiacum TaxID=134849 RepID=A0A1M7H434_9ACTN|nr:LysR family transcriptional regulator [Cryptosporangium aurantiacum]SHM23116.1 DNA-binding transcriptional regulator, LysR family [Cryptosporangium aurantiacum]